MTRGTGANTMIAFTRSARIADAEAGTRPAPELDRHQRIERERDGYLAEPAEAGGNPEPRDAIAVAAGILEHDGSQESALETQSRALANADHLAVLNAMWQGETAGHQTERYRRIVLDAPPAPYAADGLTSPQATWLWRTLRAAEAAGLDAGDVVRQAIGSRSLAGARDVASVVDARIRRQVDPLVPRPQRSWSEQVPEVADPERGRFLADLAAAMDARKERIGEHAAEHAPGWAVRALGPVPGDPLDRLEWERRAADGTMAAIGVHDDSLRKVSTAAESLALVHHRTPDFVCRVGWGWRGRCLAQIARLWGWPSLCCGVRCGAGMPAAGCAVCP
jgi:hypothetical protein